jgi:hypothetical protein
MKERMENDLMERFDDAEILYRDCEQKDALFSRFAEKVSELLGIGRNHPAYADDFDTLIWPPNDHLNWPPEDKAI